MKMLVFFLEKCVRNAVKTMAVDRKKTKSTSSAIFGVKPLRKAADSSGVPTEFEQNRRGKFELFARTLSPNFFSPKLNFSPFTKKRTEYSFELFFSINKFAFDFCCLCLFCYNAGQHAISRPKHTGFSTGLYPVYEMYWQPCGADGRTYGCTDVRTDGHVNITSLPKFLGLIGYQISLAMVLR